MSSDALARIRFLHESLQATLGRVKQDDDDTTYSHQDVVLLLRTIDEHVEGIEVALGGAQILDRLLEAEAEQIREQLLREFS